MTEFLPLLHNILKKHLSEEVHSIQILRNLGSVNSIFDINGQYIIRLNHDDPDKKIEYQKEYLCLHQAKQLGIPGPSVLAMGLENDFPYMLQAKLPGINGKLSSPDKRALIWKSLGQYAAQYQSIQIIEDEEVRKRAFHKDWKARLLYNINELNDADSLLQHQILKASEQKKARQILGSLLDRELQSGLVHGDLAPRNVLVDRNSVYLLDWGCAEINVVPHIEIGILQMSDECSDQDLNAFLKGYGISLQEYQSIADEIKILKFLHHLDKYRWAEGRELEEIAEYRKKVRDTFEELPNLF